MTIRYDSEQGHVCSCSAVECLDGDSCMGHPAGPSDPMGETVYCDGSCAARHIEYAATVDVVRDVEPTESGSYLYSCSRCGASAWSGA